MSALLDRYPGLAPCPCCGETDAIDAAEARTCDWAGWWLVCDRCALHTDNLAARTEAEAVREWEAERVRFMYLPEEEDAE